jgi:hypothetical protein
MIELSRGILSNLAWGEVDKLYTFGVGSALIPIGMRVLEAQDETS